MIPFLAWDTSGHEHFIVIDIATEYMVDSAAGHPATRLGRHHVLRYAGLLMENTSSGF